MSFTKPPSGAMVQDGTDYYYAGKMWSKRRILRQCIALAIALYPTPLKFSNYPMCQQDRRTRKPRANASPQQ
ncbi:MAG: hypothetical protein ACFCBU_01100 [Cyanophyceae cyanobacterium]